MNADFAQTTVGVVLQGCTVDYVVKGGSAWKSGLVSEGDRILSIDGREALPENVVRMMRGSVGTIADLELLKPSGEILMVKLERKLASSGSESQSGANMYSSQAILPSQEIALRQIQLQQSEEIADLRRQLEAQKDRNHELELELVGSSEAASEETNDLKRELARLRNMNLELESALHAVRQGSAAELNSSKFQLEEIVSKFKEMQGSPLVQEQLQESLKINEILEKEIKHLQNQNRLLLTTHQEQSNLNDVSTMRALQQQVADLSEEARNLKVAHEATLVKLHAEMRGWRERALQLQNQLDVSVETPLKQNSESFSFFQRKLESAAQEREDFLLQLSRVTQNLSRAEQRQMETADKLKASILELEISKIQIKELNSKLEQSELQALDLSRKFSEKNVRIEDLQLKLKNSSGESAELNLMVTNLESELGKVVASLEQSSQENSDLKKMTATLTKTLQENEDLQKAIVTLELKIAELAATRERERETERQGERDTQGEGDAMFDFKLRITKAQEEIQNLSKDFVKSAAAQHPSSSDESIFNLKKNLQEKEKMLEETRSLAQSLIERVKYFEETLNTSKNNGGESPGIFTTPNHDYSSYEIVNDEVGQLRLALENSTAQVRSLENEVQQIRSSRISPTKIIEYRTVTQDPATPQLLNQISALETGLSLKHEELQRAYQEIENLRSARYSPPPNPKIKTIGETDEIQILRRELDDANNLGIQRLTQIKLLNFEVEDLTEQKKRLENQLLDAPGDTGDLHRQIRLLKDENAMSQRECYRLRQEYNISNSLSSPLPHLHSPRDEYSRVVHTPLSARPPLSLPPHSPTPLVPPSHEISALRRVAELEEELRELRELREGGRGGGGVEMFSDSPNLPEIETLENKLRHTEHQLKLKIIECDTLKFEISNLQDVLREGERREREGAGEREILQVSLSEAQAQTIRYARLSEEFEKRMGGMTTETHTARETYESLKIEMGERVSERERQLEQTERERDMHLVGLERVEEMRRETERERDTLKLALEEERRKNISLELEAETHRGRAREAETEIAKLAEAEERVRVLQREVDRERDISAELREKEEAGRERLEKEIARVETEREKRKERDEETERWLADIQRIVAAKNISDERVEKMEIEIGETGRRLGEMENKLLESQREIKDLLNQVETQRGLRLVEEERVSWLQKKISEYENRTEMAEREAGERLKREEAARADLNAARERVTILSDKLKLGEVALAELDVKYNKAKLDALEMEKRAADAQVSLLRLQAEMESGERGEREDNTRVDLVSVADGKGEVSGDVAALSAAILRQEKELQLLRSSMKRAVFPL